MIKSTKHYYVEDSSSMNTKTERQLPLTNIPWTSVQLPLVTHHSLPQTGNLLYLCIFFFLILCSFSPILYSHNTPAGSFI